MAKDEFINNLRTANNLFAHMNAPAVTAPADLQKLDPAAARAAAWLRPQSVKGFDPADFPELGDGQKAELQTAVDEFSKVANQVGAGTVVTPEQVAAATPPFDTILAILRRYLAKSPEESSVEGALKSVHFPPWVVNWDLELGNDHYDEPALFVYLYLANDEPLRADMVESMRDVRDPIRDALSGISSNRYPYIKFRRAVEHTRA